MICNLRLEVKQKQLDVFEIGIQLRNFLSIMYVYTSESWVSVCLTVGLLLVGAVNE